MSGVAFFMAPGKNCIKRMEKHAEQIYFIPVLGFTVYNVIAAIKIV